MSDLVGPIRSSVAFVADASSPTGGLSELAAHRSEFRLFRTLWVWGVNILFTLMSLPSLLATALLLLVLNPFYNPGPLFFVQERVGRDGRLFRIFKFRTMIVTPEAGTTCIAANEGRITRLGAVLRRFRIDELPNFINVVLGDMNVIGPRPDVAEQAQVYIRTVYGYRDRFRVKPGITGLAQVVQGYAACENSTRRKARFDRFYVRERGVRLDVFVVSRTLQVMLTGFGSR